MNTQMN